MSGVFSDSYRFSTPRWSSTIEMPSSVTPTVRFFSSTS